MRLVGTILSALVALVGLAWIAQGSGLWGGTVMSPTAAGPSMWLWIGIALLVAGLAGLWWFIRRR